MGHSPRGRTELDTPEATEHTHQSLYLAEFGGFKSSGSLPCVLDNVAPFPVFNEQLVENVW